MNRFLVSPAAAEQRRLHAGPSTKKRLLGVSGPMRATVSEGKDRLLMELLMTRKAYLSTQGGQRVLTEQRATRP